MKENEAFRIPFITKKQLKSRQALHRNFLKPQYKVQRGVSILYCNASFSDVPSFSKMSQPPGQNQQMILNSVVYHHRCPSRIASRLKLTFIRDLTLINTNLIQQIKQLSLSNKVQAIPYFQCIEQILVYNYIICTFLTVIVLNILMCSYCCKLFVIKCFYLLPQVMHSAFGALPCAHVTFIGYFLI